jgi:EAL domain-containing protein (putative c-di-GMP-specific phosphodiesterase class I)
LPPQYLEVEITESLLLTDTKKALKHFRAFKSLGLTISLDDFGTGYSSLGYLKHFPIDTVKIDKAFVHDLTRNADDSAIAQAIISMAHVLKMQVIAEGVETQEQVAQLRKLNCDEIQGYWLCRPIAVDALDSWLQKRSGKFPKAAV